jgi:Tfp pilus assembly protein PilO
MKMTPRDRVLLGVLVVLLLCGGFYKFVLTPERHRANDLQTQIASARTSLATAQQKEIIGHAAETALAKSQTDWVAAQKAVPENANVAALLKLLARSASAAHVTMRSISLAAATSSSSSSTGTTTGATASAPALTSIPVSLVFEGGYQALNRVVDRLDTYVTVADRQVRASGPLVGISSVDVTPLSALVHATRLSVQLTATIYQRSAGSTAAGSTEATG